MSAIDPNAGFMAARVSYMTIVISIWRFPEIGLPQNHPFIDGTFINHYKVINHPFFGTPHSRNPPYMHAL